MNGETATDCGCPVRGRLVRSTEAVRLARSACAPECALGRHRHDEARIVLTFGGEFETRYDDLRLSSGAGDALFRPRFEEHRDFYAARVVCLSVSPTRSDAGWSDLGTAPFIVRHEDLRDLSRDLFVEMNRADPVSALALDAISAEIAALLFRRAASGEARTRWLARVRDRLEDEWATPPSLRTLARDAGREATYVATAFKRAYRKSIGEYVRERRLCRARALLANRSIGLAEIAQRCGFVDQSHFTRHFKRRFSLAPGKYRERDDVEAANVADRTYNR